jgi:hypothetical protein
MGILPVITTSWMRDPPEEWKRRKGIPMGTTCLFTRIQAGKIKIHRQSFEK